MNQRQKKKLITGIVAIIIVIGQFLYQQYMSDTPYQGELIEVTLEKCIDGDTAWFNMNGEKVKSRFLYIDTPESTNKKEYLGKEASEFTQKELENANKIEVKFNHDGDQYDKYDRALLWVFVDGELLQEKIAKAGYVKKFYDYGYDYEYKEEIIAADQKAQQKKVGLYQ